MAKAEAALLEDDQDDDLDVMELDEQEDQDDDQLDDPKADEQDVEENEIVLEGILQVVGDLVVEHPDPEGIARTGVTDPLRHETGRTGELDRVGVAIRIPQVKEDASMLLCEM